MGRANCQRSRKLQLEVPEAPPAPFIYCHAASQPVHTVLEEHVKDKRNNLLKMAGKFAVFGLNGGDSGQPKDIFAAAEAGNTNWITKIVERSIEFDINQKDNLQRTALHWAAEMGHVDTVQALVEFGIDSFSPECNGRTAVHLAARSANADVLRALLEPLSAADRERMVNMPDNFGITAVFLTTQKGTEGRPAFEVLMSYGGKYSEMTSPKASSGQHPATAPAAKV